MRYTVTHKAPGYLLETLAMFTTESDALNFLHSQVDIAHAFSYRDIGVYTLLEGTTVVETLELFDDGQ